LKKEGKSGSGENNCRGGRGRKSCHPGEKKIKQGGREIPRVTGKPGRQTKVTSKTEAVRSEQSGSKGRRGTKYGGPPDRKETLEKWTKEAKRISGGKTISKKYFAGKKKSAIAPPTFAVMKKGP